jgi:protein tyrosine phosphatase
MASQTTKSSVKSIKHLLRDALPRLKPVESRSQNSSPPSSPSIERTSSAADSTSLQKFLDSTVGVNFSQRQFKRLGKRQEQREMFGDRNGGNPWTTETGRYHDGRNRYQDILPYNSTRVALKPRVDGTDIQGRYQDYINASYVSTPNGTQYIATQGPIIETIKDFWRMVWDRVSTTQPDMSSTIIMLTQLSEGRQEKCVKYWPEPIGAERQVHDRDERGEIQNTLVVRLAQQEKVKEADCLVSTIELFARGPQGNEGPRHQVKHLHYYGWRDHSIPDSTETFLKYFQLYRQYHTSDAPPVVHCSAGIGRTGVFIALDYLFTAVPNMSMEEILKDPVFNTVDQMRKGRMLLVYKPTQLEYMYALFRDMVSGRGAVL